MKTDESGQAFPSGIETGMSLRDWFAGQALSGMCTAAGYQGLPWDEASRQAFAAADAMLAAREGGGE